MPPRLYLPQTLHSGEEIDLPAGASRHVQVLRLQPGQSLTLFNGQGTEWDAEVLQMGRQTVTVRVAHEHQPQRELKLAVTLALGMPANDRMDFVVEKAGELGAYCIQPLMCERSVLRLQGERAQKKQNHWQAVAAAASEQCGRTTVTAIEAVRSLGDWLTSLPSLPTESNTAQRWLLSPTAATVWNPDLAKPAASLLFLSGPEGGLSRQEEDLAQERGFTAVSLGPRVLRADTAPLAVLAALVLSSNA
ncbi:MAG: 16S rRNA (uracil(1498)-N(3))-methyltransferase [Burkholderiales bacterium]